MEKKLGFGMMRLPLKDSTDPGSIDIPLVCNMVDAFLEQGFTYFDTAWFYHNSNSERTVKEALSSRHPRQSYTVTSKLPSGGLKSLESRDEIFFEQLNRTGLAYFDYYLLHAISGGNLETFEKYDCFQWLRQKKEQGLVKHIGFSYHDGPELLDRLLTEHPELDVVQLQINYLDWESPRVQSRACYEVAVKHGKKILVMEPVKGGALANVPESVQAMFRYADSTKSAASWAVRFAASLPGVLMVLSGMSNMEQLLDNTGYMAEFQPLNEEERRMVHFAAEVIEKQMTVACTGCAYCVDGCPKDIPIAQYFALYNRAEQGEDMASGYAEAAQGHGKAGDCIACGACEKVCPQHLPIRKYLRQVAEKLEG